jgi:hypothetical protein
MDELVRWLGKQFDEDERIAKRAAAMKFDLPSDAPWERARLLIEQGRAAADERHIAAHDPARVLREIEAKRRIVAVHALAVEKQDAPPFDPYTGKPSPDEYAVTCAVCGWASDDPTSGCLTLRLLALPYADRPGYREEWAP